MASVNEVRWFDLKRLSQFLCFITLSYKRISCVKKDYYPLNIFPYHPIGLGIGLVLNIDNLSKNLFRAYKLRLQSTIVQNNIKNYSKSISLFENWRNQKGEARKKAKEKKKKSANFYRFLFGFCLRFLFKCQSKNEQKREISVIRKIYFYKFIISYRSDVLHWAFVLFSHLLETLIIRLSTKRSIFYDLIVWHKNTCFRCSLVSRSHKNLFLLLNETKILDHRLKMHSQEKCAYIKLFERRSGEEHLIHFILCSVYRHENKGIERKKERK